jgi:hypothetical protein
VARNRYGWQKRAKELARKEKRDEKMNRRQGKPTTLSTETMSAMATEGTPKADETAAPAEEPADSFRQGQG